MAIATCSSALSDRALCTSIALARYDEFTCAGRRWVSSAAGGQVEAAPRGITAFFGRLMPPDLGRHTLNCGASELLRTFEPRHKLHMDSEAKSWYLQDMWQTDRFFDVVVIAAGVGSTAQIVLVFFAL